jgi:hypothetical protein
LIFGLILLVASFALSCDDACASEVSDPGLARKWSLIDLGYKRPYYTVYSKGGINRELAFRFHLPPGATQGRSMWYLLDLRFTLTLRDSARSGVAWVTASTRGDAASQTRFKVGIDRRGARTQVLTWDRLERGYREWVTRSHRIPVRSINYLPDRGVRGGVGKLHIYLARYYGVPVSSMRVSNRSAILAVRRGPPELTLKALSPKGKVTVGESFRLPFALVNRGVGRLDASVTLRSAVTSFGDIHPAEVNIQKVGPEPVEASFKVRALRPGRRKLILAAKTPPGDVTGAKITLLVHPRSEGLVGFLKKAILAVVFIPSIVVLVVDHLARRRMGKPAASTRY